MFLKTIFKTRLVFKKILISKLQGLKERQLTVVKINYLEILFKIIEI